MIVNRTFFRTIVSVGLFVMLSVGYAAEPLVGWNCKLPPGANIGDQVDIQHDIFQARGGEKGFSTLRFLSSQNPGWAAACHVFWVAGTNGKSGVAMGPAMSDNGCQVGWRSAVIQCGEKLAVPKKVDKLTVYIKFKLNAEMSWGGPPPGGELPGTLVNLLPGFCLFLQGRGATGKDPRVPIVTIHIPNVCLCRYIPELPSEIRIGEWNSLVVSVNMEDPAQPVKIWINGKNYQVRQITNQLPAGKQCEIAGPVLIGGDRSWSNTPIDLESFAVYDQVLTSSQVQQEVAKSAAQAKTTMVEQKRPPEYVLLSELNHAATWDVKAQGLQVTDLAGKMLQLSFSNDAGGDENYLLLKKSIPVGDVNSVNFWYCLPAWGTPEFGVELKAVFSQVGKDGKLSAENILLPAGNGWSSHVGVPNARRAGLWKYVFVNVPHDKGAVDFLGLKCDFRFPRKLPSAKTLLLKDFGLERINYKNSRLYYVVGNYRDNFAMTGFNGAGARALTEASGGSEKPYVLLDNMVDQAKHKRPSSLDLCISVFDEQDRMVYSGRLNNLQAKDSADFFRKIEIPVTAPGTYWIRGKSFNSATGEYFTTDWTQLIIIKGTGEMKLLPKTTSLSYLEINPDKPFGRLEKSDPREIAFQVRLPEGASAQEPYELRYAVIPYSVWIPGWEAVKNVPLEKTLIIEKSGVYKVPYEKKHSVELVIAKLWGNGKRIDREERVIGVCNIIDPPKPPPPPPAPVQTIWQKFTGLFKETEKPKPVLPGLKLATPRTIPSLSDLTAENNGWMNSQIHGLRMDDAGKYFAENLDELKKLSPNVGFLLDPSRLEPIPGVYDWDALQEVLDLMAKHGCHLIPYLAEKWPTDWMPIEFILADDGTAHRGSLMWGYMVGRHNYCSGRYAPEITKKFNQQLARRFLNHPGFGGYYFENEHISPNLLKSTDPGNRAYFSQYLQKKYGSIAKLNQKYGTNYSSFKEVQIPTANPGLFPKKIMNCDLEEYMTSRIQDFVLDCQFNAVRDEDSRRPILVYSVGRADADFFKYIAAKGGMMANGGTHSNFDIDWFREMYNAIPGLIERMEPHGMWQYEPFENGYDEMIFGMLAMGGRGLHFHFFLPKSKFNFDQFKSKDQPGNGNTGYYRILETAAALKELRPAEKLHDQVGIMELRQERQYLLGPHGPWVRPLMGSLYVMHHIEPRIYHTGGDLGYLDPCRLLFLVNEVIDQKETAYLQQRLQNGAFLIMSKVNGEYNLENPDEMKKHYLLDKLGIDILKEGGKIKGIPFLHDVYKVGNGKVLVLRSNLNLKQYNEILPVIMKWAGINDRLADSEDPFMQIHVLKNDDVYYMVTTHRGKDSNAYNGPTEWEGKIKFLKALPAGRYRVTDIWNNKEISVLTPAELAGGFDAGKYTEMQMKIFRIKAEK